MSEWIINTFNQDDRTGWLNTHSELDHEKYIELCKLSDYFSINGITKVQASSGTWLSDSALSKLKEEIRNQLIATLHAEEGFINE